MIRGSVSAAILVCIAICPSYGQSVPSQGDVAIDTVLVSASRKLADIGVQKTALDSTSLRESVTNSLADVLSQNTSIFIKSYGRATLSTASFRGTAPSHTKVSWNGMNLNSPMLGMVDFSMIPSYFIDGANLYHGASSVGVAGGALGGAIALETKQQPKQGLSVRYIQGVGSFRTYDEFLGVTYGRSRWRGSTRANYVSSRNDYKYSNIYKYGYPSERNRNGEFNDLHVLQELYYNGKRGSRWSLAAWFTDSERGVAMLDVNYKESNQSRAKQYEQTIRTTAGWQKNIERLKLSARIGYAYTDLLYRAIEDVSGTMVEKIGSQNYTHTLSAGFDAEYIIGDKWMVSGSVSANQPFVNSFNRSDETQRGDTTGYNKARMELFALGSVRYKPTQRWGIAINLRSELYADKLAPLIPALLVEYIASRRGEVVLKASAARNYRYPTLNDLYFTPGGNIHLRPEKGYTYDAGVEFALRTAGVTFRAEATAFDSYIDDWIVWINTAQNFMTPRNMRRVHSYGLELKGKLNANLGRRWTLALDGNYTITKATNHDQTQNGADQSRGKQLVYIPKYSAAINGRLSWRNWTASYKWSHYSERFATTSNQVGSRIWRLLPYYMNDLSVEKRVALKKVGLSLKLAVNNLFDEGYETELSRPMPGRNFGVYLEFVL